MAWSKAQYLKCMPEKQETYQKKRNKFVFSHGPTLRKININLAFRAV